MHMPPGKKTPPPVFSTHPLGTHNVNTALDSAGNSGHAENEPH